MSFEPESPEPRSLSEMFDIPDRGPAPAPRLMPGVVLWLALALAGLVAITLASLLEGRAEQDQPLVNAILVTEGQPPWDGTEAVIARRLPEDAFPFEQTLNSALATQEGGREAAEILGLHIREELVSVDLPDEVLEGILGSGRLPERGKPEVLAGALARLDEFTVDETSFTVVGRLQRSASGFAIAYVLPRDAAFDPLFDPEQGGTSGWLDPEGLDRIVDAEPGEDAGFSTFQELTPSERPVTWIAFIGLTLVLLGGSGAQVILLRWLAPRTILLRPFLDTLNAYPRLLAVVHGVHFAAFLGMMGVAMALPVMNLRILTWVTGVFTTGDLEHIGRAYFAGNVLDAARHTFANNFIDQTFIGVIVPGSLVPFFGTVFALAKNLIAFSLAGFAMAPIWTGYVTMLICHSVTIVLELEAYVLAAFMVTLVPVRLVGAIRSTRPAQSLFACGGMVVSGTFFIAGLLAFAALYEAVTLVALL